MSVGKILVASFTFLFLFYFCLPLFMPTIMLVWLGRKKNVGKENHYENEDKEVFTFLVG